MSQTIQQLIAFGFGGVFVVTLLIIAVFFSRPTAFQYVVFKTVLALAAAGVAAMIPGFLELVISTWLRAGGALAVFIIVYFYNPARLILHPIAKTDSKLNLVDCSVSYDSDADALIPELDIKIRNTGEQSAFIKEIMIDVLGEATYEDCRRPRYALIEASATYDIDLVIAPRKNISHSIKPADVDRIKVRVGRSRGGPTLTVYKVTIKILYDEDNKELVSEPFFLKMVGPMVPAAFTIFPGSEKDWNECVARNRERFAKIGYKIYDD